MKENSKRITLNLEEDIIKIAKEKAQVLFKGDLDGYVNWLICNNNIKEVRRIIKEREILSNKSKPKIIKGTEKIGIFNNVCEFCKKEIYPGDEICKAEGFKNYIHKNCTINECKQSQRDECS